MTTPDPVVVYDLSPHAKGAMKIATAAKFLDVSPETIRKLIRDGKLDARSTGDRGHVLVTVRSIETFLAPARRVHVVAEGQIA